MVYLGIIERFTDEIDIIEKRALRCDRLQSATLVVEGGHQVVDGLCGHFGHIPNVIVAEGQRLSGSDTPGFQSIQFIDYLI